LQGLFGRASSVLVSRSEGRVVCLGHFYVRLPLVLLGLGLRGLSLLAADLVRLGVLPIMNNLSLRWCLRDACIDLCLLFEEFSVDVRESS
jgi:hypothetical protein